MKKGWKKMLAVIFSAVLLLAACGDGEVKDKQHPRRNIK